MIILSKSKVSHAIVKTVCISFLLSILALVLMHIVARVYAIPFAMDSFTAACVYLIVLFTVCAYKYCEAFFRFLFRCYCNVFRRASHYEIDKLAQSVIAILDLNELANYVINSLVDILHIKNASFHVLNDTKSAFHLASSYGFKIKEIATLSLSADDLLITIAKNAKTVMTRDSMVKSLSWQETTEARYSFVKLRAQYVFPVRFEGAVIGLLNLSFRNTNKPLSKNEVFHIKHFSRQLGIALNNARKYSFLRKKTEDLSDVQSQLLQNAKIVALEQLAAGIAHEIHNPLTIISGKAQVLLLKGKADYEKSRVDEVLQTIVEQTKRAAEITRRLLMFAKRQDANSQNVINIENVINDTISLVSYQVSLDDIRIVKVIETNVPLFEGSLFEIRELFLNLILNAIHAIGQKGVITITIKYIDNGDLIRISIADTGHGIEKEKIPLIFDPFYTTSCDRVGLGLFVCQQIVSRHGGAIKVESEPDNGSVFVVAIPLNRKKMIDKAQQISSVENVNFVLENKS